MFIREEQQKDMIHDGKKKENPARTRTFSPASLRGEDEEASDDEMALYWEREKKMG